MIHYNYSSKQLEDKAEGLLRQFDAERLIKTKPIDVYGLLTDKVSHYRSDKLQISNPNDWLLIKELAAEFSVSPTTMKYRLMNLDLAI